MCIITYFHKSPTTETGYSKKGDKCAQRYTDIIYLFICIYLWQPNPVFQPGEPHGVRSLADYSPQGYKQSDTTEETAGAHTHTHTHTHTHIYLSIYLCLSIYLSGGFPGGLDGKKSACNMGDQSSIPGSGRSLEEANGYPFQYSSLGNAMDAGAWQATVLRVTNSQT